MRENSWFQLVFSYPILNNIQQLLKTNFSIGPKKRQLQKNVNVVDNRLPWGQNSAIKLSPETNTRTSFTGEIFGFAAKTRDFEYIQDCTKLSKKNCLETFRLI